MRRTPLVRRSSLRRSRMRPWRRDEDDKVTPEVRAHVLARDGGCVARVLDSPERCWGRITLDHVKAQQRMGDRAPSDPRHLVALCQGHTEDGRRAGFQWNTAKENRHALREYLRSVEVPPVDGGDQ